MTRVLVTGASGFIGRRVIGPLVDAGHEVHALSRSGTGRDGVAWYRADLLAGTDVVATVRPDVLVHLAWYAEHGRFWTATENVVWVEASLALLRAFAAAGGRRAVVAGSCAEYDWAGGDGVLREHATPLRPATLYGASKHGLHVVAGAFAEQAGIELAWGRVFFLYGPDEAPGRLVRSVATALLAGEPARTTAGTQIRDFLHADDVGAAFAALAAGTVSGAVNIGAGTGVALRDVVGMIGEAAGRPDLIELGALPPRAGDPPLLVADTSRLRDELSFVPAIALRDGIERTVAALRDGR